MNKPKFFDKGIEQRDIELLTASELAKRLKVSEKTIRNWRYQEKFPYGCCVTINKRVVRYHWGNILLWLTSQESQHAYC